MKKSIILSITFLAALSMKINAQEVHIHASVEPATHSHEAEHYGNTLNLGAGIGYYGYLHNTLPVVMVNYEFDVARNFTLAPFVGAYTYQSHYYWKNPNDGSYRYYSYRATAIPVGLKGTYYFDQLFHAHPNWDFYAAGSLGFVFRSVTWESGYYGDRHVYQSTSPLYLDAHIGAEYHLNNRAGLFLDLSSGLSTFGVAFHL
jgi:hypothetical protein